MKVFVISDIHGSYKFLNDFMKIYNEEKSDLLVILGDILYHGPRNPLPLDYNPQKVASLLNEIKDNILWIKGNCDGEVDEMVLDFPMVEKGVLFVNDHRVFLTHGHKYNEKNMTLNELRCYKEIIELTKKIFGTKTLDEEEYDEYLINPTKENKGLAKVLKFTGNKNNPN